jgi:hypothetical protein
MTDAQFEAELTFWDRMRGRVSTGREQHAMATSMIRNVILPVDLTRRAYSVYDQLSPPEQGKIVQTGKDALAGLALSQFVRRTIGDQIAKLEPFESPSIDIMLGNAGQPVAFVHEQFARLNRLVPPLTEGVEHTWYEDEVLAVRAHAPATPTPNFLAEYNAESYGWEFAKERYVTLQPYLKSAYVGL